MMVLSGERSAWQCEAVFRRQRLLRAGSDTTLREVNGKTALMIAKDAGYTECARAIEEHAGTKLPPPPRP